jgi:alkanesulfonate monooxygenase SsuD/methylene tetrahydromethanopterin reductase-like flavin-dependent oxidoreductase (luciferase family)
MECEESYRKTHLMRYGLYLPNFGAFGDARLLADLARDAEQAGWDGFFLWDHIVRTWTTEVVDPWIALTAIALSTTRIRFGTLVTPLARRRPWKVARETVSLDQLSGGRLILGVGLGSSRGQAVEWANFGEELDLRTRAKMLDEGLEIVTGLWSGKPFTYEGLHYRVRDSQFLPTPVHFPRIPIWVAGNWPHRAPFRRAARWDGMVPQFDLTQGDELTQLKQAIQYTQECRENDSTYEVVYSSALAADYDSGQLAEQLAQYAEIGVTWWLGQLYPQHFGGDWQGHWPVEPMRQRIRQGPLAH